VDVAIEAWNKAADAWQEDPSEDNKTAYQKAVAEVKESLSKAKPVAVAAPDKYEIKPAEGITIDDALLSDVTPSLKEAGLSNDQLNKLAPIATKIQEKAIAAYVAQGNKALEDQNLAELKASKEALGAKWPEQMALVAKARDRFFSEDSRKILAQHGNNIHLINDLVKLGTLISEGKFVDGKPVGAEKSAAEIMFPSMAQS
jgi:hypothetical protein